jgi:hypothetical protein
MNVVAKQQRSVELFPAAARDALAASEAERLLTAAVKEPAVILNEVIIQRSNSAGCLLAGLVNKHVQSDALAGSGATGRGLHSSNSQLTRAVLFREQLKLPTPLCPQRCLR